MKKLLLSLLLTTILVPFGLSAAGVGGSPVHERTTEQRLEDLEAYVNNELEDR